MSATITLQEAQAKLTELVHQMVPGEEVIITENQQPVVRMIAEQLPKRKLRVPGNCKGMITLAIEDDEHLKDFKEYMP